ncbi:MAG: hypothetical protein AB7G11_02555 [Phycisphaerales bacterium]
MSQVTITLPDLSKLKTWFVKAGKLAFLFAPWVLVAVLLTGYVPNPFGPQPPPSPPGPSPLGLNWEAEGRAYRADLAEAVAATLADAATQIDGTTKPLPEVKELTVTNFRTRSAAAFDKRFVAGLDQIVPPGTETPTSIQRAAYARAFEGVAKGLRTPIR